MSSLDSLLPTRTLVTTGGGLEGAVTSMFKVGSLVAGGGGEGVTLLEPEGGRASPGTASLVVGGATCLGGVAFRAAQTVKH